MSSARPCHRLYRLYMRYSGHCSPPSRVQDLRFVGVTISSVSFETRRPRLGWARRAGRSFHLRVRVRCATDGKEGATGVSKVQAGQIVLPFPFPPPDRAGQKSTNLPNAVDFPLSHFSPFPKTREHIEKSTATDMARRKTTKMDCCTMLLPDVDRRH